MQIQSFKDFPLTGEILRSIEELGFESLFPIQAQAIMPLLEGKDVIGQAQTGTGKTAAFGIPMVQRLNREIRGVQGLILVPTRELAVQVAEQMALFAKYAKLKVLAVYGGESINKQIHSLAGGVHIPPASEWICLLIDSPPYTAKTFSLAYFAKRAICSAT